MSLKSLREGAARRAATVASIVGFAITLVWGAAIGYIVAHFIQKFW